MKRLGYLGLIYRTSNGTGDLEIKVYLKSKEIGLKMTLSSQECNILFAKLLDIYDELKKEEKDFTIFSLTENHDSCKSKNFNLDVVVGGCGENTAYLYCYLDKITENRK